MLQPNRPICKQQEKIKKIKKIENHGDSGKVSAGQASKRSPMTGGINPAGALQCWHVAA
jgi:hypothetical protein